MWTRGLVLAILMTSAACGKDSSGPIVPSPPVPSFQGHYSGTYTVTDCAVTVGVFGGCSTAGFTPGSVLPVTLSLVQSESSVTGEMTLGGFAGPFTGTVQASGVLAGSATMVPFSNAGLTIRVTVTDWNSTVSGSSLSGTFTVVFLLSDSLTEAVFAEMRISATIAQLLRS